jgi:anti-sigma B factor antagonist
MEIKENKIGNVIVLKIVGRLDSLTTKNFREKVKSLAQQRQVFLVLDLSDVDFMDSSGLGSLVAGLRSVGQDGGNIKIAALQPRVRALFELTRLHQIFEIFEDTANAVDSYTPGGSR